MIFMISALAILLPFNLVKFHYLWFLVILYILPIPINAIILWLIAKGSDWVNLGASMKASGAIPGGLTGVLLGGFVGFSVLGLWGGILLAVSLFIFGQAVGARLGDRLMHIALASN